ncbi:hypothetical protein [Duganella fentianensis]|uniref:hypothetical protein n=1 Tax=Duganella fentianensis TaxID=2692177 RepID=UPI0032B12F41
MKKIISTVFAWLFTLISPHVDAQTWTLSTYGHITAGSDDSNAFGAGKNLNGLQYVNTLTISVDPKLYQLPRYFPDVGQGFMDPVPGSFTFTSSVTINGKTVQFEALASRGIQQIFGWKPIGSTERITDIMAYGQGASLPGGYLFANWINVTAPRSDALGVPNFQNSFSLSAPTNGSIGESGIFYDFIPEWGNVGAINGALSLEGNIEYLSVNSISPVPEPFAYVGLLLGIVVISLAQYQRRRIRDSLQ